MKKMIFAAGLPRSGSTLALNILAQNPDIYVTSTSPLYMMVNTVKNSWQDLPATLAATPEIESAMQLGILRGMMAGAYGWVNEPIVIDKNRAWMNSLEMLDAVLDESAKVLVFIRDIMEIVSSLEMLYRNTRALGQLSQEKANPNEFATLDSRARFWLRGDQLLGSAFNAVRDAIECGYAQDLCFVEFDDLTGSPKATMEKIYNYLELDEFDHDFKKVVQVTQEDDRVHRFEGLHDIRSEVKPVPKRAKDVLGAVGDNLIKEMGRGSMLEIWRASV